MNQSQDKRNTDGNFLREEQNLPKTIFRDLKKNLYLKRSISMSLCSSQYQGSSGLTAYIKMMIPTDTKLIPVGVELTKERKKEKKKRPQA